MIKVSVVVPVYNAGPYLERSAPSLLHQSLGPEAYEVVYVNDGSTDGSAERLERLASKYAHVRVIHQENSGWPGRPRNVGVREARGEYVQFVDQDDELTPGALDRLYRMAVRNGSDIVMGRTIGTMQGPHSLYKRDVERCSVEDMPLMESLTPHKMFRRAFLLEHGIEFPEGRVRLEDQLFMARAYVRAKTVSILGSHPCYVWNRREDGGNNSAGATTPEVYYGHLRSVVEAIREGTDPGPLQDFLLRRSYRVELLRPVTEPRVLQRTGADLERHFDVVREMALDCYPPGVREGLPALTRLRATLLEEGRLDSLVELARRVRAVRPQVTVDGMRWRDGRLLVSATIGMLRPDGRPLTLVERHGRLLMDPELLDGIEGAEDWEVPHPLAYARGELLVHDTGRDLWWFPDADMSPRTEPLGGGRHRVVVSGETAVDPRTLSTEPCLRDGTYEVWAYGQLLGVGRRPRFAASNGFAPALPPALVGSPPRAATTAWTGPGGQLRLLVGRPPGPGAHRRVMWQAAAHPLVRRGGGALVRRLPSQLRRPVRRLVRQATTWTSPG
ncbi:glycosyltransferase [Streptomyces chilikensis]|uniref:Glycosyltransferase n=1 Tax=Streptomyces chilikensis TaxID=1194079 RepID=A0ABV3ER61_9ACTN